MTLAAVTLLAASSVAAAMLATASPSAFRGAAAVALSRLLREGIRGSNAESRGAAQRRGHGRGDAGVDARGELGILFTLDDVAEGYSSEISASAPGAGNSGYFRPKKRSAALRDPEGAHCSTRARSPREPASRRPWCL